MKKPISFVILLLIAFATHAQNTQKPALDVKQQRMRILMVPFVPNLFRCDLSRELCTENHMNVNELNDFFRNSLRSSMNSILQKNFYPIYFNEYEQEEFDQLRKFYANIQYDYLLVPLQEDTASDGHTKVGIDGPINQLRNLKDKRHKKHEQPVAHGQVTSTIESKARYMAPSIKNKNEYRAVADSLQLEYCIQVSQLDIMYDPNASQFDLEMERFQRVLVLHYSIFDRAGNIAFTGIAKAYFSNDMNLLSEIQNGPLTEACRLIVARIPNPATAAPPMKFPDYQKSY